MIEICTRLGLALVLSVTLAVLLAWGWDNSDTVPVTAHIPTDTSDSAPPLH
ncbi:MAG TPA: hypothetical protein VFY22_04860 [Hydrogenophaga sp.]|nr:hypothetical protein [Hydrogenophaga sp.]